MISLRYTLIGCLLILFSNSSLAQLSAFKKLYKPERLWVMRHPFVSSKALRLTKQVLNICGSEEVKKQLDTLSSGGKLDAFRHIYWMAMLTEALGEKRAHSLGVAHEKANYIQYQQKLVEERELPDYPSSVMDSLNNLIGIQLGINWKKNNQKGNWKEVVDTILAGECYILKRDQLGNYLTCNDSIIPRSDLKIWRNDKCVVKLNSLKK